MPIFINGTRHAKALVKIRGADKIECDFMIAGLLIAARQDNPPDGAELVRKEGAAMEALLRGRGIELTEGLVSDVLGRTVEGKVPVSAGLGACIKAADDDLASFVRELLKSDSSGPFPENRFVHIALPWIVACAGEAGGGEVSGDAFGAGAFLAFEAGAFRNFAGVSSVFAVNRSSFEALITRKFGGRRNVAPAQRRDVTASSDLRRALSDGDSESQRFITAVNLGMRTGTNLLEDERTAFHEAGHAVVSWVLRPGIPVSRVLVKREKDYDGVTVYDGTAPDIGRWRREDYLVRLCVCLAGRAAQYMKFGDDQMDAGASDDLRRATEHAWQSIAELGLDPEFGPLSLSALADRGLPASGWLFDRAQQRLEAVMREAAKRTEAILAANWPRVEILATMLIEKGEVDF